jgi:endogenous inhibitor of DNA gyrase (YacG/DUF329 family)
MRKIYKKCKTCQKKLVLTPSENKRKFCSVECIYKNSRCKLKCANCRKTIFTKISRLKKSKHKKLFCSIQCKGKCASIYGKNVGIRPKHYGTGSWSSRKNFFKYHKKGCKCGIKTKYLLVVHHKDGDTKNNVLKNLELVCQNCHVERHLYIHNNEWKYSTSVLTPRNKLSKVFQERIKNTNQGH